MTKNDTPNTADKAKRIRLTEVSFGEPEVTTWVPRQRQRSAAMLKLDGILQKFYSADPKTAPVVGLPCAADADTVKAFEAMLRRSANYLGYGLRFGGYTTEGAPQGMVKVLFKVTVKSARGRKPKNA